MHKSQTARRGAVRKSSTKFDEITQVSGRGPAEEKVLTSASLVRHDQIGREFEVAR